MGAAQGTMARSSAGSLPESPETELPVSVDSPDSSDERRRFLGSRYENKRPARLMALFEDTTTSMLGEHFNPETPPGLFGPPLSPLEGPEEGGHGLVRTRTVTQSLDARFRRAALFQRAAATFPHVDVTADQVVRHFEWLHRHRDRGCLPAALRWWLRELRRDPWLRVIVVVSGVSGGLVWIVPGAAAGLCVGASTGFAVGLVPATLTFGLSIPTGMITGGVLGAVLGGSASGGLGSVSSAAIAASIWEKREDIRLSVCNGCHVLYTKAGILGVYTQEQLTDILKATRTYSAHLAATARTKANKLAKDQRAQYAALGAAGGSVALGTSGGAMGLLVGSATGAAWGVLPAFFTFGLSIPVGAMVAGTAGLVGGAVGGGTLGFWGGGVVGAGFGVLTGNPKPQPPRMRKSSSEVTLRELSSSSLAALDDEGPSRRPSRNGSRNTMTESNSRKSSFSGSARGTGDATRRPAASSPLG